MQLALRYLGSIEVSWLDQPVTFATTSARALFAYLSMEADRPHSRELLAALLWPDQPQTGASANLRQTLARIRKAFPEQSDVPAFLSITPQTLQFNRAAAESDVADMDELLAACATHAHADIAGCPECIKRLVKATALYRGEFLHGLFLEQSQPFEEWLLFKREALHQRALAALDTLTQVYRATGDMDELRRCAALQLKVEPWREEAHRHVMLALASSGRREAALAQYETCRRVLASELGVEPGAETRALYERIRAGEINRAARPTPSPTKPPNNLPVQLNPFIGRGKDVAALVNMLAGADGRDARIVTLTGPGGMGKTRLALQAATALSDRFSDGARFVNLAPIGEVELVIPTIALSLGVKAVAGEPLIDTLKHHLRDKQLLLLLDNFEQVSGAGPQVSQLVAASSGVRVLVTSRVPLRIAGEKEYPVPPLALPPVGAHALPTPLPLEELTHYEAVRLFIERATDIKPDFGLTDDSAYAVAEICVRLDGLPLAIELAAARIRLLSPRAILSRLQHRLTLLTQGPKDVPARQQTLRGAIEWSYNLLDNGEKQLFRQLAVFVGGCTLEAVEAVCQTPQFDVLEGVGSLVHNSLLRQVEGADGEPRFTMLETIHEFAREKLAEVDQGNGVEWDETRCAHATFFVELAERADAELKRPKAAEHVASLQLEYDNLRAALEWASEGMGKGRAAQTDLGLRLAAALWRFWLFSGYWSEGSAWLATFVSGSRSDHPHHPHSHANPRARAEVLYGAGYLAIEQGDYRAGRAFFEESVLAHQEIGDNLRRAAATGKLGDIAYAEGDYASARLLLEEAVSQFRILNDKHNTAAFLSNLGELMRAQGDYASARRCNEEALAILAELEQGETDWSMQANVRANLGHAVHREGDYERAVALFTEALTMSEKPGHKPEIAMCLLGLAGVAGTLHAPERAARLLGATEKLIEILGAKLWPADRLDYEHTLALARTQLDEATFERARSAGRAWSLQQAIDYALERTTDT